MSQTHLTKALCNNTLILKSASCHWTPIELKRVSDSLCLSLSHLTSTLANLLHCALQWNTILWGVNQKWLKYQKLFGCFLKYAVKTSNTPWINQKDFLQSEDWERSSSLFNIVFEHLFHSFSKYWCCQKVPLTNDPIKNCQKRMQKPLRKPEYFIRGMRRQHRRLTGNAFHEQNPDLPWQISPTA